MKPQTRAILTLLQKGLSVTPYTALRSAGCFRLAARIHELRSLGYRIEKGMHRSKSAVYAKYWMSRYET